MKWTEQYIYIKKGPFEMNFISALYVNVVAARMVKPDKGAHRQRRF